MEPTNTFTYRNGYTRREEWRNIDNQLHNNNGPAVILYYNDGSIRSKQFYQYNKRDSPSYIYNSDAPTKIDYFKHNGYIKAEYWHLHGVLHRRGDKPAEINYHEYSFSNSTLHYRKEWFNYGEYHRDNGPAIILYDVEIFSDKTPTPRHFRFYWHGKYYKDILSWMNINSIVPPDIKSWVNDDDFKMYTGLTEDEKIEFKLMYG